MWGAHEGMGWWMLFGGIWMAVFWVVLIGSLVWLISRAFNGAGVNRPDPLHLAKERYARGEITREEFQRISEDLSRTA